MAKAQVTIPLDIPEVRVLKSELNKAGELIITVESTKETAVCHRCGRVTRKFHGYDSWVELRYLPVFGRPTYLRYRPKRYRYEYCKGGPTTSQRLDWHEPNRDNSASRLAHLSRKWNRASKMMAAWSCQHSAQARQRRTLPVQ